ncbi:hypothetical protein BJV85_002229 [Clostridium acetobutylicum]|nr:MULTISPECIES: hypothetical protein [Clostridium]MBC2394185.1 hypothetical protein [Clostridium acetobutylicum]MBC2584759.1 hypothetical protein [Clostridium acetobutylicum]NOV90594.1 hypothetical protein [Clostridium acetobutylicum]NOW14880.1 hypothetical protein [Clostridium acetobutylicum]NRY56561.1 hypothetical protein [Clostridium acetobutylicum]
MKKAWTKSFSKDELIKILDKYSNIKTAFDLDVPRDRSSSFERLKL